MNIEHWMMFSTFAEQDFFTFPNSKTYSGCLINANMAAHAPAGLAAFLIEKTAGLKYVIDPLTHAFQHEPSCITDSKDQVKKAIRFIADTYGSIISTKAGISPIYPKDFLDTTAFQIFVENCMNFQRTILYNAVEKNDSAKYLENLELSIAKNPYAIIAPYFYMTSTTINDWLPINLKSIELSKSYCPSGTKLFAELVLHQNILIGESNIDSLIKEYSNLKVDGFFIWIDELDEHNCNPDILKGFSKLAKGLRGKGQREVINIHGGYFSILLAGIAGNNMFTGVSHGPEYGENRAVIPVGGGIPTSRYYIPQLHNRIKYREALRVLQTKGFLADSQVFHQQVCNCQMCRDVLNGDTANFPLFGESIIKNIPRSDGFVRRQFPTSEAKERCLKHYLLKKLEEYKYSENTPKKDILDDLTKSYNMYCEVMALNEVSHLRVWNEILSNID